MPFPVMVTLPVDAVISSLDGPQYFIENFA
jgi:hypothetical protein